MLIFSVSFQFCRMIPERNPMYMSEYLLACRWMAHTAQGRSEGSKKKLVSLLDLCVSFLRRGHANLLCIVAILTDDPRKESNV